MQNLVRLRQAGSISSRKANLYFSPISNGLFNHVSSSSSPPDKTLIDPSPSRSCLSQYLSNLSLCATRNYSSSSSSFTAPTPPPMNTMDAAAAAAYQPPRRVMDFVREIGDDGNDVNSSSARHGINQNADILHIKLVRNNTIVTLTDYKGDSKFWLTAGCVKEPGVGKKFRYEATARQAGRMARDRGVNSVVLKVNGNSFFARKKKTILAFREGYNESGFGPDRNPIVFLEDTTRLAHNGCRLRKRPRK